MHKDKIICGNTGKGDIAELNEKIDKAVAEGYSAIDISMASRGGSYLTEVCVLLCKKTDK